MGDNAAILDELFGTDRNLPKQQRGQSNAQYWNDEVCKFALVSLCYNDLWKHTKYDSDGECNKRHDQHFINAFQADLGIKKLQREKQYIQEAISYINDKIKEVDKILKRHQQNLEQKEQIDIDRPKEVQERLENFKIQRQKLLDESERLGELGKLEESERLAQEADNCKHAAEEYILAYESTLNPFKTCRVCDICGAKQALQETERKQQTHLEGKIHQGFEKIRAELVKLSLRKTQIEDQLKAEMDQGATKSKHSKSRSRNRSKKRSRSQEKKRSKHNKQSRSQSRNKKKDKKHKRSN